MTTRLPGGGIAGANPPDIRIAVVVYEGHRGAERPSSFLLGSAGITVTEIIETWVQEEHETRKQRRFFTIKGSDGVVHTLYYDLALMEWFYRTGSGNRGAST